MTFDHFGTIFAKISPISTIPWSKTNFLDADHCRSFFCCNSNFSLDVVLCAFKPNLTDPRAAQKKLLTESKRKKKRETCYFLPLSSSRTVLHIHSNIAINLVIFCLFFNIIQFVSLFLLLPFLAAAALLFLIIFTFVRCCTWRKRNFTQTEEKHWDLLFWKNWAWPRRILASAVCHKNHVFRRLRNNFMATLASKLSYFPTQTSHKKAKRDNKKRHKQSNKWA